MSRFTLNFETFARVKITEKLSFPSFLNLNDYMKGYENIENKEWDNHLKKV